MLIAIWVFGVLIALELPLIRIFLKQSILQTLEDEYFEAADLAPTGLEESSLSSGSDVFLAASYYRSFSVEPDTLNLAKTSMLATTT